MIGAIVSKCERCGAMTHGFWEENYQKFMCEDCYNSVQPGARAEDDYFFYYIRAEQYNDIVSEGGEKRFTGIFNDIRDIECGDDPAYVKSEAEANPIEKVLVGGIVCARQKLSYL